MLTDHASDLLLCSTADGGGEPRARGRGGGGAPGGRRDGRRLARVRAGRRGALDACWTSTASSRASYLLVTAHRAGNVDDPERLRAAGGAARGAAARRSCSRSTRARARRLEAAGLRERLERRRRLTPPLGYLDFLKLARHARAVLTDSGGVQKEAYLLGVPCVTLRDTTEWVETVEAGWNVLVDLDREAALAALERPLPDGERPELYGGGRAARAGSRRARRLHCRADEDRDHRPRLRRPAAGRGVREAGHEVVGRGHRPSACRRARARRELRRGRPRGAAGRGARAAAGHHPLRGPRASVDAVVIAVPTPLTRNREPDLGPLVGGGHVARRRAPGGPARGARVHHLPGHHARAARAAARGVRARRRARLQRGLLARAGRPGPHRLHAAQHAQGGRRAHRRVPRARGRALRARSATTSSRSRRPRPPSSPSCSRTSSAR